MNYEELTEAEAAFADLIWAAAPIGSGELVRRCEAAFGWKKSTTYTMLKRLEGKGLFVNEAGTIEVRVTREEFESARSAAFVARRFDGSLPRFVAAFTREKRLCRQEIEELQQMIDSFREEV